VLDDAQPHAGGFPKNDVHTVLVKVETDEGLTGWGEGFSNAGWQSTCTAIAQIIAPRVVGRDPSQIAQIQADLHRGLYNTGRSGPTVCAISGLDIALWDIAAKRAGLPLYKLLGGSARHITGATSPSPRCRYRCSPRRTGCGNGGSDCGVPEIVPYRNQAGAAPRRQVRCSTRGKRAASKFGLARCRRQRLSHISRSPKVHLWR
jgi:hypothetical protein